MVMVPMLRLGLIMTLISPTCRTISFFPTTPAYQGQLQALHTRQAKRVEEEPKAPCKKKRVSEPSETAPSFLVVPR